MNTKHLTGYISLRRLYSEESPWFATAGKEFGLWYMTVHACGLYFGIIGPFAWR